MPFRPFYEIRNAGSFAAVAGEIDLAPSSVLRAISSLEMSLKSRLFQRTTRTVTPTQSGDLFYGRVAPLLDELWAVTREIRGKAKVRPDI